ncbi:MAG: cobalt-precorrin-5B (C(1))-methyltransferase [Pseudomonadota bacterium]|nr:cobalt-precorrin-5B (C(1))-methyltransferase [Pseudomonadota bacterium]
MTPIDPKEIDKEKRYLQRGWTTGACATAASKAAYLGFLTGEVPKHIEISLPGGKTPIFAVSESTISKTSCSVAIEKDAGDDPDVTHGAIIRAKITKAKGLTFSAGNGVGVITKPGLPLDIGEPAINPGPREMIKKNLSSIASAYGKNLDVEIEISVDNGELLAKKTWNPRLGILGGISILGTTGVVIPYSCAAWIASIHRGIDVARAIGLKHVAACTGKTSEKSISTIYNFDNSAILDMGDFVGGTLKYLRTHPISKLTIAGGFGKISKLAAGHMDLHSKRSQIDPTFLSKIAKDEGVKEDVCRKISNAETASNILEIVKTNNLNLGDNIALLARELALSKVNNNIKIEVVVYDRLGQSVGRAAFKGNK